MATRKTSAPFVGVDALKHPDDKRRNIPTAEYQSLLADEARKPVQVAGPFTVDSLSPHLGDGHRRRPDGRTN
jgi:adenine-specific DNA-methyltransferase